MKFVGCVGVVLCVVSCQIVLSLVALCCVGSRSVGLSIVSCVVLRVVLCVVVLCCVEWLVI